jgi:hypothetical protein
MDTHTPNEPQPEETIAVEPVHEAGSELTDDALDDVSGGSDFSFTHVIDKPTPIFNP